ncbi:MAG: M20 family metallo-hydrolase [Acidobacteriota bacterium]|nr:M20 family metallo-hydrolase [Acidobacteriota bacterium]
MNLTVNYSRIPDELETLAAFSDVPSPAVTRIVFSAQDLLAREWFKQLCVDASLAVREDAVGNTFARWEGSDPDAPAIGTGSHIDAIPHSGRYDGTVGVLGGLEAIRALKRAGYQPARSIELLLFTSEEPTRFGPGCLGSRLLTGSLDASVGETLRDSAGDTLNEVRATAGFTGGLETVRLARDYYQAFVELHIEQGPLLERRGIPIGVVTAIAAPASLRIEIEGQGGHAGAVLMPDRHDAFLAAAEIALAIESAAKSTGAIDSVGTTGVCDIFPRVINGIPSRVHLEADIRDVDRARRDRMLASLEQTCAEVAHRRGVSITQTFINRDDPATCDPKLVEGIENACRTHGIAYERMVSRAYHDSLFMSRICPAAMIFIPCRNGVSHRPDEYASPEAIALGVQVLAETLAHLASRLA